MDAAGQNNPARIVRPASSETAKSVVGQPADVNETSSISIMPPDVKLPPDVPLGQYRRMVQPFLNWILVCDENLKVHRKVCNVSQTFVRSDKGVVFSWSLAATESGQPYFILRVPHSVGANGSIAVDIPDGGPPVSVAIKGCSDTLCLAYQPAGPRLRAAIEKRLVLTIAYAADQSSRLSVAAPLDGLVEALAAI